MDNGDPRLYEWCSRQLLGGKRLFVSGGAGSGKTYFVRRLVPRLLARRLGNRLAKNEKIVVAASTGMAAIQLMDVVDEQGSRVAGPVTLHSAALIPWSCHPDGAGGISGGRENLKNARVIIVDEISMTDRTTFERFMQRVPGHAGILVVGDFYQLAPVDADEDGQPAYAFTSPAFAEFELIELEGNRRQTEPEFQRHVNLLRRGDSDHSFYAAASSAFDLRFPVLFGTNAQADAHNAGQIESIQRPLQDSTAVVEVGKKQRALQWLWKDTRALPTLPLKETMRVMCVQNHTIDVLRNNRKMKMEPVVNGDIGTVQQIGPASDRGVIEWVDVTFDRLGAQSVRIRPLCFEQRRLRNGRMETIFAVRQLPLRPAYGLTVHKAQGISLDVANIEGSRINFAPGQAFVAVSRCRTKSGLHIANAHLMRVFASVAVHRYYDEAVRVDPAVLDDIRIAESSMTRPVKDERDHREPLDPRTAETPLSGCTEPSSEKSADILPDGQPDDDDASLWPLAAGLVIGALFIVVLILALA